MLSMKRRRCTLTKPGSSVIKAPRVNAALAAERRALAFRDTQALARAPEPFARCRQQPLSASTLFIRWAFISIRPFVFPIRSH